ncbi:MAG: hypothetical protein OYH76_17235 [Defluviicoccus sp.]|nr:hypothetical protein [Defluviicoccus sp.]MDE0277643.1 hypothetical protein [Defluviicoccus sp.]
MPETLSLIGLTPEDIARLPADLRERMGAAGTASDTWLLVGEGPEGFAELVERTVGTLPALAAERGIRLTEANIEKMLDVLLSGVPRARVETGLDIDNARLRADYLRETPLLAAADIRAASGLAPRNRSEPASRWKREGRLFAVRRSGIDLYPAFQFADGSPRPAVKAILAALPDGVTGWQTAMWFASANGWLDGAAPQDRLTEPEAVIEAARRLADPAIG